MASRIEVEIDGAWVELPGALLHIRGFDFRVIFTSDLSMLAKEEPERMRVRVDGRLGENVSWSVLPLRGYASCEMRLPIDEEPQ